MYYSLFAYDTTGKTGVLKGPKGESVGIFSYKDWKFGGTWGMESLLLMGTMEH